MRARVIGLTLMIGFAGLAGCTFSPSGYPRWISFSDPDIPPPPVETMALEREWEVEGNWNGAAVDPATGDTFSMRPFIDPALGWCCKVWRVDRRGATVNTTTLASDPHGTFLRLLRRRDEPSPGFVTAFKPWGDAVCAFDSHGRLLWTQRTPQGVGLNDVWTADLDSDGNDEVIVGFTGAGLRVFNADGALRWENTKLRNVWSVCSFARKSGGADAVAVSGLRIYTFDASGAITRQIEPGMEPWGVRVAQRDAGADPVFFSAYGSPLFLTCTDSDGHRLWQASGQVDPRFSFWEFAAATDAPWIACSSPHGGRVYVYDVRDGRMLASIEACCWQELTWVPGTDRDPALLIVGATNGLMAFRMMPIEARPPESGTAPGTLPRSH